MKGYEEEIKLYFELRDSPESSRESYRRKDTSLLLLSTCAMCVKGTGLLIHNALFIM